MKSMTFLSEKIVFDVPLSTVNARTKSIKSSTIVAKRPTIPNMNDMTSSPSLPVFPNSDTIIKTPIAAKMRAIISRFPLVSFTATPLSDFCFFSVFPFVFFVLFSVLFTLRVSFLSVFFFVFSILIVLYDF